ncbi:MAG: helix-turn-helix transcriptional regulator [Candidatus Neomarinimicrobiota bacterium]
MSREVDDYFDEIDTKIPEDVSRLVEKQMDIAEAIAGAIERSEFKTRKAFAAAIGMKESMLSRILAGNVNLTLKTITKIESALNTDIISVGEVKTESDLQMVVFQDLIAGFSKYLINQSHPFLYTRQEKTTANMSNNEMSNGNPHVAHA